MGTPRTALCLTPPRPPRVAQFEDLQGAHALLYANRAEFQSLYYYRPWMYAPLCVFLCLSALPSLPPRPPIHIRLCSAPRAADPPGHCPPGGWGRNRQTQNEGYINYTRVMWSDHSYSYDNSAYQVRACWP